MSIRIIPIEQQGRGEFNGGEIVENKPIGFPQDQSIVRPYANLFYWAHARATTDSTIGLHPHQGFEICSFVLKGSIRHFDTQMNAWKPLEAGDVQIIRAGSGISHSEWLGRDGEIFQIWFDPDLSKTLRQPASYDDYPAAAFPVETPAPGLRLTTLAGPGSPFRMDTPGVSIQRIELDGASHSLAAEPGKIYSAYLLEGEAAFNGNPAKTTDFVLIAEEDRLEITATGHASVFVIAAPAEPGYRTYWQMQRARVV